MKSFFQNEDCIRCCSEATRLQVPGIYIDRSITAIIREQLPVRATLRAVLNVDAENTQIKYHTVLMTPIVGQASVTTEPPWRSLLRLCSVTY